MKETRIKISSIVENQLPQFVIEEFPLVSEFLSQYYISLENQGNAVDILQNIDQYVKVDNLTNLIESTTLTADVTFFDSTINVISTAGFPKSYGLLLIDSEIITYTSKTSTTFEGCVRGFNGVTSYLEKKDELTFTETESQEHFTSVNEVPTKVTNLSILFLKEFLNKVKKQITPGFESRQLYSDLNERLFIKQSKDFYSSKGTDNSFKILFGALYGETVDVIRPSDYLIQPSDAQYRITSDLVVESIEGDPEDLINTTIYQKDKQSNVIAQGTVTQVEKIIRNTKNYYIISLDSDYNRDIQSSGSIYGKFEINPKTRVTSDIISGSTTLEVDSTVGFETSNGNLIIDLENGTALRVTYASKTLNQFLECQGISQNIPAATEVKNNLFASTKNEDVKVRVLGVLSELNLPTNTNFYSEGDLIRIKSLGLNSTDVKFNNWFFNVASKYNVSSISLLDSSDKSYRINLKDNHFLKVGDLVTLLPSSGDGQSGFVVSLNNENSFDVQLGSNEQELNVNIPYIVKRNISKVFSENYPEVNKYTSNVQNVYSDDNGSLYVSSPSLPTYLNRPLEVNDRSITFSGSFVGTVLNIGNHGLYTGDSIVYKPSLNNSLGISAGIYFIKRISDTEVQLARSRNNIFKENFVTVNGTVQDAKFNLTDFANTDLSLKSLQSQKIIRKISSPQSDGNVYKTNFGSTGIFINGVEVLNYKSKDNVYYGPIENIIPTASGSGYDVINPPILTINDPVGSGATGYCSVIGHLERIDIIDPGYDYVDDPVIEISGGNGFGAAAKANLISLEHNVPFNSQSNAGLVQLNPINILGFSTYHRFRTAEEVTYLTDGQSSISGLTTNSTYFVSVQDAYNVKLHSSYQDAISGINTIQLSSYGVGNHSLKSKNLKRVIGSISIINSGSNYQNKLVTTNSIGINTATNTISIQNHGYESGEIVVYNATETPIGGLSSSVSYYVTKINSDEFRLSEVGAGNSNSFFFDTKQYVNLTTVGSGTHKFNYPEIKVSVKGKIGVSTLSGQTFDAIVQPIFRGKIESVFVPSGGSGYGSENIINHNRQPLFELDSGFGAEITPIVLDGKIISVVIKGRGRNYNSPPNLKVSGSGSGAVLTPVILNGRLVDVKIINSGFGYKKEDTFITVNSAGVGAKFEAQIKSWRINLVERLAQSLQIKNDDGILTTGLNDKYGLQYTHAYAPRSLRSSVQSAIVRNGEKVFIPDLQTLDNQELVSRAHSPIIGWSYDGYPIYGPYGYSSKTGGSIRSLTSGYEISLKDGRPSTVLYPQGFFIEDYDYTGNGDLDEHNGRFGVTPEYPNGTYAYFTTINSGPTDPVGLFAGYKRPVFPYVIGDTYKSKPIDFNFVTSSNQDNIDINKNKWRRNINPYNIATYDYLFNPNRIKNQNSIVKNVSTGFVNSVGIVTGGKDYKVGDRITFNSKSKDDVQAAAKVSLIKGKAVNQISVATSSLSDVQVYPNNGSFLGITTVPHNYLNNDLIVFSSKNDYQKFAKIKVRENILILASGINSAQYTGLVTYFDVFGDLSFPNIKENDFYQVGDEQVKILNVDTISSRVRVLRNQNGTSGLSSIFSGIAITERSNKFKLDFNDLNSYNLSIDREFYFDPAESIGIGTTSGVGIVSTIYFSNPGVGITQLAIPTQSIYIKNHNLKTGDSLIYSSNGGTQISVSTDGASTFQLQDKSIVYVAKISNDLIGISTVKVGLSSGIFVSLGSSIAENSILYFNSVGTGDTHSFKTRFSNTLTGEISKNTVTVSTAETHGLSLFDNVIIDLKSGISTTVVIKYNDYNRRLISNPRTFSFIDTTNNTITINNHGYYNGQKVIYTSNSPSIGLIDENIYYVIVVDSNKIKLSESFYKATLQNPEEINISSSSSGSILPINPPLNLTKNQTVIFDLSDPSLSFTNNSISYSGFEFKLYKDNELTDKFDSTLSSPIFEVSEVGSIGITTNARVILRLNDNVPNTLYYTLVPVESNINSQIKKDIIRDEEVVGSNKITISESEYNGNYEITKVSSNNFSFNVLRLPEEQSYSINSNEIKYYTDSTTEKGPIHEISVVKTGKYTLPPNVVSVSSTLGSGAILFPNTSLIGNVKNAEIQDIGFDYSSDYSVRPIAKLPSILILDPLSSFDYIEITSPGKNYNSAPSLVVIDTLTNEVIEDIDLFYNLGDSKVTIAKNTNSLSNAKPTIIPINNSNGIKIENITFNNSTKDVTVALGASFSDPEDYPFKVGDKVLIEGISVGIGTTGKGYNSSNYNYALFTLTAVDPNIGGTVGIVTYNLSSYLQDGETPGTFNSNFSAGKIVLESDFPIFNPVLKKNVFYEGELIYTSSSTGKIESWDEDNQYLKVSTIDDFFVGQTIKGKTSGSESRIQEVISFETDYTIDSSSRVKKGWNKETGFLNNDLQRVHDSDYYQYFSYDIKSKVSLDKWGDAVSSLNHTAGFKKFANLIIESKSTDSGISTDQNQGDFSGTASLSRLVNLNCVHDFDLARENNLIIDGKVKSNEILFDSRIIQDYIESIGNKVLMIDDISDQFNSNPRSTEFSLVDTFNLNDFTSKKYFILVQDRKFVNEKQFTILSMLHNNAEVFLNQYGLNTLKSKNLGFFDFNISGELGNLLFYPVKTKFNNYNLQILSFSLNNLVSGIGTVDLGSSVKIHTSTTTIPQGTGISTSIVGIASTYRSSKILVQINASDSSYHEIDELTILNDGNEIHILDYGQITTDNPVSQSSSGIGTYDAYLDGSQIKIDLYPYTATSVDYIVNTFNVSLANSITSDVGSTLLGGSSLNSFSIGIASSSSPTENILLSFSNEQYNSSYCIISIEDKNNSEYQVSELLVITNSSENECYFTEFGILQTGSTLGVTTARISGTNTEIYFTPKENIEADIKVFAIELGLSNLEETISLTNGSIEYNFGSYTGTNNDIKKDFDLLHKNDPIFQRYFDARNPSIVNIESNVINIPNIYVTGEEIKYSYPGVGTTQAIGIATTSISGIGLTDKLPPTLYVVKLNDFNIRVSASASDALKDIPNVLTLTSVGEGIPHVFTSTNQNKKAIIQIDNVIQSPVVSTSTTTTAVKNVTFFDSEIFVSSIDSFFGGDLIKIDDEIMKISSVGVGSTNTIGVIRSWLGTGIATHSSLSLVTKVKGNYNIIDNKIYFAEAPFGKVPFVNISDRSDEQDYIGIATGSSFSGRVFVRSGINNSSDESYSKNYIFDDISNDFNGIDKTFELKSNGSSVTGISTDNAIVLINDVFQGPSTPLIEANYELGENSGITTITFTGSSTPTNYDINVTSVPRGGIILSIGSSQGFGYQPLVAAGGTAIVSAAGTIQSISIGNSGSGYRPGVQSIVNVGVTTLSTGTPNVEFIGTASINDGHVTGVVITNPGFGYTSSNPPIVVFDDPLSYSNIPLIYSSQSSSGVGTGAVIDIVVGQGSSVISFEIKNFGYGYKPNQILTVSVGGTTGIPTNTSLSFSEFQISIDRIFSDKFAAWTIGSLQVIDPLDSLFDGNRKVFPISVEGNRTTIRSKKGSNIDVQATLLVFINDVLQVPGEGYIFSGGSTIRFTEAPKEGDKSRILFYRGTENVDTQISDILETIKVGDTVALNSNDIKLTQDDRLVTDIISSDILTTNLYPGPGITEDENLSRPLTWCRQTEDLVINGQQVGKDRILYEPYIQPSTNIIQSIGIGSTIIFVESVRTFFDSEKEYIHDGINEKPQNKILIISQDSLVSASATAVVSTSGTISSIVISNGGVGYSTTPTVSIAGPIGFGTTTQQNTAMAVASISNGSLTGIAVTFGGSGYSVSNPPVVLIETPLTKYETIDNVLYDGDFGNIIGFGTTTRSGSDYNIFDFYIPNNSYLRDENIVGTAITISQINVGDFFVVKNSNIGIADTEFFTYKNDNSPIGVSTQFIDGIYQVNSIETHYVFNGIGNTHIKRIFAKSDISSGLGTVGLSTSAFTFDSSHYTFDSTELTFDQDSQIKFYGEFSWGKITLLNRPNPKEFSFYGFSGIDTSASVVRFNRLKYVGYST